MDPSVEEIRAILDAIHPYLPENEVQAEIDVFGSSSMDALAHGWSSGFGKFHPEAKVVISAEGSETVFNRLAEYPASVGMISRPVTIEDLKKLQEAGLKRPAAIMIAREALGIFVNSKNPLEAISFPQLKALFGDADNSKEILWNAVGVSGALANKPVQIIGRTETSGTQTFIREFLFRSHPLRAAQQTLRSNAEVVKALEDNPAAIAIAGLKCGSHGARSLHLIADSKVLPSSDHAILVGQYPLTRPLTLVLDVGREGEQAEASREFVRFALSQAGQMQAILSGFFPFDPPTLRAEEAKLELSPANSSELETATRRTNERK